MKIHRIQRIVSIIPFYSSFFVLVVSLIELKKYKASIKRWVQFYGLAIFAIVVLFVLNNFLLPESMKVLKVIASAIISIILNFLLIEIQVRAWKERPNNETNTNPRKDEAKMIIGLVGWLTIALIITIGVVSVALVKKPHPYQNYADTNGDSNTSLALISQEDLLTGGKGVYGKSGSGGVGFGGQTHVELEWTKQDYDKVPQRWGFMTGIQTLQATKIEEGTLVLDLNSTLTSGNAEIIIIVDGECYGYVPVNENVTITLDDVEGKTVLVRMGCEAATIDITVERTILGQ